MSSASSVRALQHKPNADSMKKPGASPDPLRGEYKASDFPGGLVRGKHASRIAEGSNIVVLDPEIAAAFPSSAAVKSALHSLLRLAAATTRTAFPCEPTTQIDACCNQALLTHYAKPVRTPDERHQE